jgi:hypothetical protein
MPHFRIEGLERENLAILDFELDGGEIDSLGPARAPRSRLR